jgi:hypothetical protein
VIKKPPPLTDILKSDDIAGAIGDQLGYGGKVAQESINEVIQNPFVEEQAQNVAVPAAVAVGVANAASAGAATATAIPYMVYLYSLLAHPTLLIARRRRKKWGVVYNSLSKLPIDLVIVRLLDATTGRIIRSAVTDKDGRYFFIIQKGQYKMVAAKAGYVYPSALLRSQKEDVNYLDLYHGELIDVKEETAITANLPLDPVSAEKTPKKILWEGIARRFQKSIGIISIAAMGVASIITPTPLVLAMFVVNLLMYVTFRRLSVGKKPKNWGIVYDEVSGKPVQNAVARIFEAKFNKLLETQVTDIRGRYSFLVGNNVYYVTFEKPGYQKQQKGPVDLTAAKLKEGEKRKEKEEEKVVAIDVKLKKSDGKQTPPPAAPPATMPPVPPPSAPPSPVSPPPIAPAVPPTAPPPAAPSAPSVTSPAVAPKIPWELQILQKMKQQAPPTPPAPSAPATLPLSHSPTPPVAPNQEPVIKVMPQVGGSAAVQPPMKDGEEKKPEIRLNQYLTGY